MQSTLFMPIVFFPFVITIPGGLIYFFCLLNCIPFLQNFWEKYAFNHKVKGRFFQESSALFCQMNGVNTILFAEKNQLILRDVMDNYKRIAVR